MKKLFTFVLTIALVVSMATTVFAVSVTEEPVIEAPIIEEPVEEPPIVEEPIVEESFVVDYVIDYDFDEFIDIAAFDYPFHPTNPNLNPGLGRITTACGVIVVISHQSNAGQPIYAHYNGEWLWLRNETGTFSFVADVFGRSITLWVQGNSFVGYNCDCCNQPYIVEKIVAENLALDMPVVETDIDESSSHVVTGVRFWAHIHQRQGNQNDTTFGAVGDITTTTTTIITTTTTRRLYHETTTIWSDGTIEVSYEFIRYDVEVMASEPVIEVVFLPEAQEWTVIYTQQNNFWNTPRAIDVGPFAVRFQPIGNTDVRVFEFLSADTGFTFEFGDAYATISPDDLSVTGLSGNAPPVTWSMHNGREGNSRWNR